MDYHRVLQGSPLQIDVTLERPTADGDVVITGYAGTEALSTVVWRGGAVPASLTATTTWVAASTGSIRVSLTGAQTATLAAVRHRLATYLDDPNLSGQPAVYEAYLDVTQAPISAAPVAATFPSGDGTAPSRLDTVYATDEMVALRCGSDFLTLAPKWQTRAAGVDGVFAAATPWVLTSALVDFAAQGVTGGLVISLNAPKSQFSGTGELFAVDSVSGHTVTLRRLGMALGVGQPPAPAGCTGVGFEIRYLTPQLDEASDELNRLEGLDPGGIAGRRPADVYDARTLRQFTVLTVLKWLYSTVRSEKGEYSAKLAQVETELDRTRNRMVVKFGPVGGDQAPRSFPGLCRITRG